MFPQAQFLIYFVLPVRAWAALAGVFAVSPPPPWLLRRSGTFSPRCDDRTRVQTPQAISGVYSLD